MRLLQKYEITKSKLLEFFIIILYLLTILLIYPVIYANGIWTKGFEASFNIAKMLVALPIIFILYIKNEKIESEYIKFIIKMIIIIMIIPISAIYICRETSTLAYILMCFQIYFVELLEDIFIKKNLLSKIGSLQRIKINYNIITKIIYALFIANTIFVLIMCIRYNGLVGFRALDFNKVYEVRGGFYLPKYIMYLYNFETKIILIFLTAVELKRKKYFNAFLTTLLQIVFYLYKADKIVLFGALLTIIIYFLFNKVEFKKIYKNFACAILCISVVLLFIDLLGFGTPLGLFIRRLLLVPANLKYAYYDFFASHSKIGLVGTVINSFAHFHNPYANIPYENLIAGHYFGQPEMFSNTGFLIEGFIRFNYIGFLIIPIILSITIYILHCCVKRNTLTFMLAISIVPFMNLNDGCLITSLTFGALGVLCVVSPFFSVDSLSKRKQIPVVKTENKKKIVFLLGASNSIHTIKWANDLSKKYEIHLLFCSNHVGDVNIINKNVILHRLKYKSPGGYYLNALEVRRLFKKYNPDLINTHYASGYGTLTRISRIKPVLLSVWGSDVYDYPNKSFINEYILKKNILYANRIASTSKNMAKQVNKLVSELNSEIFITPFGVDTELFNHINNNKKDDFFVIGTVKSLEKIYCIDDLVKSIKLLRDNLIKNNELKYANKIRCYIYGDGSEKEKIQELIIKEKLENYVFLKGKIDNSNVPKVLNNFDVFCACSEQESFGVAIVEAMACEVPVIATKTDGFTEIIDDKTNGFLVDVHDSESISKYCELIMKKKLDVKTICQNARRKVLKEYDWNKNVDSMQKIYETVINENSSEEF